MLQHDEPRVRPFCLLNIFPSMYGADHWIFEPCVLGPNLCAPSGWFSYSIVLSNINIHQNYIRAFLLSFGQK